MTLEHNADLDKFLQASDDFANVFTTVSLDDFRSIKECKTDNIVHLVSHVSTKIFYLQDISNIANVIIGRESHARWSNPKQGLAKRRRRHES